MVRYPKTVVEEVAAMIIAAVDRATSYTAINKLILKFPETEEVKAEAQRRIDLAELLHDDPVEGLKQLVRHEYGIEPDRVPVWIIGVKDDEAESHGE